MTSIYESQINLVDQWARDPVRFATEALKIKKLSAQQINGLQELAKLVRAKEKLADGKKMTSEERMYAKKVGISIQAGMGVGKDFFASVAILWMLCCFPRPIIPCTAPTAHQLRDVLWREIQKVRLGDHNDPPVIKDWVTWQSDKIFFTPEGGRQWFAIGRTANPKGTADEQAETLQGFHEDYMMIVADEASAIPDAVFRPLEGTLTGKVNFILMIFNPVRKDGFAIDSQQKNRDQWITLHWPSDESELVTKESIEYKRDKYGEDSNFYRVTVKGMPPLSSTDTLIPYEWAMDAVDAELEPLDTDQFIYGLDIGAGGDPSIILPMKGPRVYTLKQFESADSEALTGWIMARIFEDEPKAVFGDVIGVGWGVLGNLRARVPKSMAAIVSVNVSNSPFNDMRFHKLRDELSWRTREKFERHEISIPNDPILIGELTTIKFEEPLGKIKVESKKELKARGLKSPNRFDALTLTSYYQQTFIRKMANSEKPLWMRQKNSPGSWKTA